MSANVLATAQSPPEPECRRVQFKGHEIIVGRETPNEDWYIQVIAPSGVRDYDGWWRGSAEKSSDAAIHEAMCGAMLIKPKPGMPL